MLTSLKQDKFVYLFLYMIVLPACVCVHVSCACLLPQRSEGIRSPGTGATVGCEPPHEYWELNPGPLQS